MADLYSTLTGWTQTADVESLLELIDQRRDALDPPSEMDDGIPLPHDPRFRAYDPHGGNGPDGRFEVATNYQAVALDGRVQLVKAGLPEDSFDPDDAEAFGRHLIRTAASARLPSEV